MIKQVAIRSWIIHHVKQHTKTPIVFIVSSSGFTCEVFGPHIPQSPKIIHQHYFLYINLIKCAHSKDMKMKQVIAMLPFNRSMLHQSSKRKIDHFTQCSAALQLIIQNQIITFQPIEWHPCVTRTTMAFNKSTQITWKVTFLTSIGRPY